MGAGTGVLALAVPLAWPSGAGGQHLDLPSAASVRSGIVRLADFVSGQDTPAPTAPAQQSGAASAPPGQVPAAVIRGVKHAQGRAPFTVPGTVPAYQVHAPSVKPVTTGPEAGGAGSSYDAATSVLVQAGTNATARWHRTGGRGPGVGRARVEGIRGAARCGRYGPVLSRARCLPDGVGFSFGFAVCGCLFCGGFLARRDAVRACGT